MGLFREVGLSQFGDLGVVEAEAKGRREIEFWAFSDWGLVKWVNRLVNWMEFEWWLGFGFGEGEGEARPREAEILVSMDEFFELSLC